MKNLNQVLKSFIQEHKDEQKPIVISAMVGFLTDSFTWMKESDALSISVKAYEDAQVN